ncbi:MAG TPA: hypothetical protein VEV83_22645 [Parafilimonas sp.]|nr:hypothetical protein [Parafilimonas sp.]
MITKNKRLAAIVLTVAILLLIPFVAMQFTSDVKWDLTDFITAAILLLGSGLLCELVMRKVKTSKYRFALIGAVLLTLVLIWLELAVGIFGTPFAGS